MTESELGIVDTHCHLWRLEVSEDTWVTEEKGPLYSSFTPEELSEASREVGVVSCVVVEAGETAEENAELERMASASDLVGAIIPYLDLESDKLEDEAERLAQHPKFRGVRMRFESHPDPGILARPEVVEGFGRFVETGGIFDFLVRTQHLPDVLRLFDRYPDLNGIIEHMAKPDVVWRSDRAEWHQGMRELARNTGLAAKLSLSPRAEDMPRLFRDPGHGWDVEGLKRYVQFMLDEFGPERLMWGSDWPVALLTSDYAGTYQAMRDAIGTLRPDHEAMMFSTNAAQFYGLELGA